MMCYPLNYRINLKRYIVSVSTDTEMKQALIVYLVSQKKKKARRDNESQHAIKELKKQAAVTLG